MNVRSLLIIQAVAQEREATQLHLFRDPETPLPPALYSNHAQVTFTPEDFSLHFGWYEVPPLTEPPEGGRLSVEIDPRARIVLPLNFLRNLIAVLEAQIEAYEMSFGPLPEHPSKPDWLKAREANRADSD